MLASIEVSGVSISWESTAAACVWVRLSARLSVAVLARSWISACSSPMACRMTADSRVDRGCYANPLQTHRSIAHRRPPPHDSPLPVYTPPTPRAWKYKTVLLYPRSSSPCGLSAGQSRMTSPLRSNPITGPSALLRATPPLCPASVLSSLRMLSA